MLSLLNERASGRQIYTSHGSDHKEMLIGFSKGFRLLWSVPMIHFDIRNLLKAS